jgi:hypothetical protein
VTRSRASIRNDVGIWIMPSCSATSPSGSRRISNGTGVRASHSRTGASFASMLIATTRMDCADGLQDPFNLAASDDLGKSWKALLNFS